jgi:hypothetical protein
VLRAQDEQALGLQADHEPSERLRSLDPAVRSHEISDLERLPLRNDSVDVADARAEEPLEPGVGVEAGTVLAHLHDPGPDRGRRRVDGYRARHLFGVLDGLVAGEGPGAFLVRRAPAHHPAPSDEHVGRGSGHDGERAAPHARAFGWRRSRASGSRLSSPPSARTTPTIAESVP